MARNKRINFLAELTKGYDKVIDIGTDHGLVLKRAFDQGYIKEAVATDLREKPLMQAMKNLKNYPVKYIISDGFLAINESFDLAILAGMGAYLISEILDSAPKQNKHYILQANEKIDVLRLYLSTHHFMIIDEYIVFDQFYYVILKVQRGYQPLSEEEIYLGPILRYKKEAIPYYQYKANHIKRILSKADGKRKEELIKMLKIFKNI